MLGSTALEVTSGDNQMARGFMAALKEAVSAPELDGWMVTGEVPIEERLYCVLLLIPAQWHRVSRVHKNTKSYGSSSYVESC